MGGIAHERGTYSTDSGPVQVEVAVAWRERRDGDALIESFVNLGRTDGAGTHVAGFREGLRRFLPEEGRERGLVAAVSVVLADVILGSPRKDRLDSPQARPAVAAATEAALQRWAAEHPAAAERLRK
jgi:DNA gyrase/topoisomerase IV subunit B